MLDASSNNALVKGDAESELENGGRLRSLFQDASIAKGDEKYGLANFEVSPRAVVWIFKGAGVDVQIAGSE